MRAKKKLRVMKIGDYKRKIGNGKEFNWNRIRLCKVPIKGDEVYIMTDNVACDSGESDFSVSTGFVKKKDGVFIKLTDILTEKVLSPSKTRKMAAAISRKCPQLSSRAYWLLDFLNGTRVVDMQKTGYGPGKIIDGKRKGRYDNLNILLTRGGKDDRLWGGILYGVSEKEYRDLKNEMRSERGSARGKHGK